MTLRGDFPRPWPAGSWPAAQQGVCRQFCLSSCGQSTVLEKGTPTPGCHLHREALLTVQCHLLCQDGGELGLGCCHWEDSCSWWWSTRHRDAVSPKALVELKHDCKHTTLSSTRVNPTACLAGRFVHPWWTWGRTMGSEGLWPYPNPPVTGKTELNNFFFSLENEG